MVMANYNFMPKQKTALSKLITPFVFYGLNCVQERSKVMILSTLPMKYSFGVEGCHPELVEGSCVEAFAHYASTGSA